MEKIKTIWEGASGKLTQHKDNVYGVYYDYESDYKGDYSLGVGIKDNEISMLEMPPAENYEVFNVDKTDEQGIMKIWKKIGFRGSRCIKTCLYS